MRVDSSGNLKRVDSAGNLKKTSSPWDLRVTQSRLIVTAGSGPPPRPPQVPLKVRLAAEEAPPDHHVEATAGRLKEEARVRKQNFLRNKSSQELRERMKKEAEEKNEEQKAQKQARS